MIGRKPLRQTLRALGTIADFVRGLGAKPVRYGDGLAERVRDAALDGIIAAADLFGTETPYAALELGVPAERVSTIAARDPNLSAKNVGGVDAESGALEHIASSIAEGWLTVVIAAQYPLERIGDAVRFQATRHAQGKIVMML